MTAVTRKARCQWCGGDTYTMLHPPVPICERCGKTPAEAYLARVSDTLRMAKTGAGLVRSKGGAGPKDNAQ